MKITLKKAIETPFFTFAKGQVIEEETLKELFGLELSDLQPKEKNEWFEPYLFSLKRIPQVGSLEKPSTEDLRFVLQFDERFNQFTYNQIYDMIYSAAFAALTNQNKKNEN